MPIKAPGGSPGNYIRKIVSLSQPTQGDLIYAMGKQAVRIQQRTVAGVDYTGAPFAPYSTRTPHYHNPSEGHGSIRARQSLALHHARYYGGTRKRGGTTIRYQNYAAYRASYGSTNVDLGGMEGRLLRNIQVNVGGYHDLDSASSIGLHDYPGPVTVAGYGIYVQPAARIAEGHNNGVPSRHLPQRRFLDTSPSDVVDLSRDIADRNIERLKQA